ncbi:MAG: 16S rRNA (guanine(527)-N(7))-methyltransferase RsmG [Fibrobacterales bacterium]
MQNSRPAPRQNRLKPTMKNMGVLLKSHGVEINNETLEKLWEFHQLLRENNTDQDLSRLNAFETIIERHYADCMIINAFEQNWPKKMLDIGSGAGFPGIPFKLIHPEIHLTLCEPRQRRCDFMGMVIEKLDLPNVEIFNHKVTSKSMDIPVGGIITRAFELMEKTLPRIENALQPGGYAYFMKGPAAKDEIATFSNPNYTIHKEHWYTIPNSNQQRSLIVLKRKK